MAFQGNAFQGNAFQIGRDVAPPVDPYTLRRGPLIYRRDTPSALAAVLATALGMPAPLLTPAAPAAPPFFLTEWPNPIGAAYPIALRTHLHWRALGLVDASPYNKYDWPNPRGATHPHAGFAYPSQWLAPPHRQTDWPNPRGPLRNPDHIQGWRALGLVDASPFNQFDWPNPRGPVRYPDFVQGFKPPEAAAPPFYQTEWPNPQLGAVYPVALRTLTGWRPLGLEDASPFNQFQWPNPRGPVRHPDHVRGFTPEVITFPFVQTEWPNPPLGAVYPVALRTHVAWRPLGLVDSSPFNQFEWPVPRGATRNPDHVRGFTEIIVGSPFYQTEWPNPRGAAPREGYTHFLTDIPPAPAAVGFGYVPGYWQDWWKRRKHEAEQPPQAYREMETAALAEVETVRAALPLLEAETVAALDRAPDAATVFELAARLDETEAAIVRAVLAAAEQARQDEDDDLVALLMALL